MGVLGTALSIFLAFRNNSAYARWWEARTLWGNIVNNSRILARQVISNADNAHYAGKVSSEKINDFKNEVVYRQIAFAQALRLHLRQQTTTEELKDYLNEEEYQEIQTVQNKPNWLLQKQGDCIKSGIRAEILGAFDNISIEPNLAALNNWQGACERIKNTPVPRQYDFFTRMFLWIFIFFLPSGLLSLFADPGVHWLIIPLSLLIAMIFTTINKVSETNENPFENRIQDVPMTSLCRTIERDLKEQLGEKNLPPLLLPEKGYLF